MVKKAAGTRKRPVQILDDNGTLIASVEAPGAARGADKGEGPGDNREIPRP